MYIMANYAGLFAGLVYVRVRHTYVDELYLYIHT